jgi:hypothetical protein
MSRRAARVAVSVGSLLLGAAVVTHGSAQALAALTPAELAAVNCRSQQPAVRLTATAVLLSGLDSTCVGVAARAALTDATSGHVTTVSGTLRPVPGSTDLGLSVAPAVVPSQVRRVAVTLGG